MIEQFAKLIPPELKDCSGAVFYSGRDAFSGLKDLYILGLNPGGDPYERPDETIHRHTNEVLDNRPRRWSEYTCESWLDRPPGEGGIQPSVVHLLQKLGYNPRDIPASNVVFVRSIDAEALKGWCKTNGMSLNELSNACWTLHQEVICHVKPKLILCMGREAERVLRRKTNDLKKIDNFTSNCSRGYLVDIFRNKRGCRLASVTHPSRGIKWTKEESDPSDVVEQALEGADVRWSSVDVH